MASNVTWWGFSSSVSDDDVIRLFMKRFGYPPRRIVQHGPLKLAGPINEPVTPEAGQPVVVGEIEDE